MSHLAGNTSEPRRNDIVLFSSPPEFLIEEEVSVLMLVCLDCSRLLFEFSWCRIGVERGEGEGRRERKRETRMHFGHAYIGGYLLMARELGLHSR